MLQSFEGLGKQFGSHKMIEIPLTHWLTAVLLGCHPKGNGLESCLSRGLHAGLGKTAHGLCSAQPCRSHFMAGLRVTWLSFMTILQTHPTCLMPLNHDKVDFTRKAESTQPNVGGTSRPRLSKNNTYRWNTSILQTQVSRITLLVLFLYVRPANKAFICVFFLSFF